MLEQNKKSGVIIGVFILLLIAGIFVSLFSGEYDFSEVKEGRTAFHIGLFLLTWSILIPISFKYAEYSFIFKWISSLEKALQFGKTNKAYTSFNTIFSHKNLYANGLISQE